jgi:two-component system nitrogen regulation sensor histidine kinase NtrY
MTADGERGGVMARFGDVARLLSGTDDRAFYFGLAVVILSLISGLATFLVLTGLTPIVPSDAVVLRVLLINVVLIIAMVAVIAVQMRGLVRSWRAKEPGSRLHGRIVGLFSLIATLPALMLAIGATTSFSRTLDGIFNRETRAIVENSLDVANAYLEEHGAVIRTDIVNMAKDLDAAQATVGDDAGKLKDLVIAQAALRDLPVAYVIDAQGRIKAAALEDERIPYIAPPRGIVDVAEAGQVPLLMPNNNNRVAALAKLAQYPGYYLYVARGVNPRVIGHLRRTQAGVAQYEQFRNVRSGLKFAHGLMYFMMSLTALLAAIWAGFWFAGRFVAPIRRLIGAAQAVTRGDLKAKLPIHRGEGDLRRLSQNFNEMTEQLDRQRADLMMANEQLSERRRFMEAVLSGVSAAVLGLDARGVIRIANPSVEKLLGRKASDLVGLRLDDALPELAFLLEAEKETSIRKRGSTEVTFSVNDEERTFAVKLTGEAGQGAVVTLDDVTELLTAQRSSAWADMARRIAHEIKNPLTPIQLSAERIRRKYGHVIKEDREVFDKCTETIIRQVGDVTRMVDEFSSFARMPKPEMASIDLRDAVRDSVTMYQMTSEGIANVLAAPPQPVSMSADRRLLAQAITNLVKNANESVQSVIDSKDVPEGFKGRVEVHVRQTPTTAIIEVIDNGSGLPKQGRGRLLEPYVTTKGAKGTGLGLAIVQKIVESHGGELVLEDAPVTPERPRGALIRITLPLTRSRPAERALSDNDARSSPALAGGCDVDHQKSR